MRLPSCGWGGSTRCERDALGPGFGDADVGDLLTKLDEDRPQVVLAVAVGPSDDLVHEALRVRRLRCLSFRAGDVLQDGEPAPVVPNDKGHADENDHDDRIAK